MTTIDNNLPSDITTANMVTPEVLECPYHYYQRVRDEAPVHQTPLGFWAVSRYEDVMHMVRDPERFSSQSVSNRIVAPPPAEVVEIEKQGYKPVDTLLSNDPPSHTQFRALVNKAFLPKRVAQLEDSIRTIANDLIDAFIDDGKVTFSTRAVIGSTVEDKHTPEFSHLMTYMELNPDWTVPPGIIRRDYLPKLQANPGALSHLQVVDSRGRVVPRGSVNFAAYSAGNFPFNLRQPPGATNALGRVKFMFPNPWSIYLHDTPDKHLFARESRAYSSGCVRLNDPFDFAYTLLAPQESDPKAAFHKVLDTGRQERIFLQPPVPVHLDYRTAFTDARGRLNFRGDIYGRDAKIWAALEKLGVAG